MYQFKTKPYAHQMTALQESCEAEYYALFMDMGTGKSKVAIDTIGYLYSQQKINAALVIAPKGVYDNWVKGEIPTHLWDAVPRSVVRWTPSTSKKYQEELRELIKEPFAGMKIFVMNVEAFSTARGTKAGALFLQNNPNNIVIIDESTTIKNRKALRTKNILQLRKFSKYRRILTGSPVTKSPMDLFSQCMFLSEKALGHKSYYSYQNRYAVVQNRQIKGRSFQEIVDYRRLPELNGKLDQFSNRVLKEECLDLPAKVYVKREVPLTDEQSKLYVQMKKLALAKLDNGELATTQSVLTQLMRLQQICCGHLVDDDGNLNTIKSSRTAELLNVCEEINGKAIIWCTYTHDIKDIERQLQSRFGQDAVAAYYGETRQDIRQETVDKFQDPDDPLRFFVGQPKTGGYGITLTAAKTVIYYSNSYDLEIRWQSEDRAHRISQDQKVTYIDFVAPDTIDEKILKALKEKIHLAGQVMGEDARNWLI
jgi:SNF2 family DNA or RNA helicase